jgi:hypothetical protein
MTNNGKALELSKEHLAMLREGSGISDDVIARRGYRTVTNPKDLLDLGFGRNQKRVPVLLIPLHTTDGQVAMHIARPDNPRKVRQRNGEDKAIKYEAPKDMGTRLDCPPVCQPRLGDPSEPLWITEGQKKADSLASRGLCAIALLGVWNWRGKNAFGGNTFLADWDYIALKGREVRIVFDSDVMTKAAVRQALDRMTEHLQRKGAAVRAVYLPGGDGGKLGVDDWFAQGHTPEDLVALVEAPRPEPQAAPATIELLDDAPPEMHRPLQIIDGRGYAAAWLPCKVTVKEFLNPTTGEVVALNPPRVTTETRLFIVRDDGVIFGDGGDKAIEDLGFAATLPEVPQPSKTWSTPGVKRYRDGQRPDPLDVFERIVSVIDRFHD